MHLNLLRFAMLIGGAFHNHQVTAFIRMKAIRTGSAWSRAARFLRHSRHSPLSALKATLAAKAQVATTSFLTPLIFTNKQSNAR